MGCLKKALEAVGIALNLRTEEEEEVEVEGEEVEEEEKEVSPALEKEAKILLAAASAVGGLRSWAIENVDERKEAKLSELEVVRKALCAY